MALPEELDRAAGSLSEALLAAVRQWAMDNNTRQVPAEVPMAALLKLLVRLLENLPPERRRVHADDFIRSLNLGLQAPRLKSN